MFIDHSKIHVKAGDGGAGALSFHTEKYITNGGPDGGDGGNGGNIVFESSSRLTSLQNFRFKHKFVAENGVKGGNRKMYGRNGEDLVIGVPVGTVIKDLATGKIIADFTEDKQRIVVAKGGKGGLGNMHYANSVRQAPQFATPGLPGEEKDLAVELKLIADCGLVGFPNAGKSTLLSVMTRAKPKIADYPFTTLEPVLGVVSNYDMSYVIADIPGIIENAHEGAGLGHDFLRHIERTRLLIHVVDLSGADGRDPIEDFKAINKELEEFNAELASRPQIVAANKCDLLGDEREAVERLRRHVEAQGYRFVEMSAATHQGTQELMRAAAELLRSLPPVLRYEPDYVPPEPVIDTSEALTIEKCDDDYWSVEGAWLQRLLQSVNLGDYESRMYFDRVLREAGVFERLEAMGIKDGDTVGIYDLEFEYQS